MKKTKTEQSPQSVGQTFELDGKIYKGTYWEAKKIFNETFANTDIDEIPDFEYWVDNTDIFQIEEPKEQVGHTPGDDREPFIFELSISKLGNKPEITLWEFGGNDGDCGYDFCTVTSDEPVKHSQLIIDAVNNTAGKGIDPEKVHVLHNALKAIQYGIENNQISTVWQIEGLVKIALEDCVLK